VTDITIMTDTHDSLNHQEKRRRRSRPGKRMHWAIWAFFTLATAIILCKAFDAINGALA